MRCVLPILFVLILSLPCNGQEDEKKSSEGLTLSLPWGNNYYYHNYDLKKPSSKSGFIGFGGSFFHKKGKNKFSFNFGLTGDLPTPLGGEYGKDGTRTSIGTFFCEIIEHRQVHRKLNIIGGINYIDYRFHLTSYVDTIPEYIKDDRTIGITIGAEYLFKKVFSIAVFYRPALISFGTRQYRHMLSVDARCDITSLIK